MTMRNLRPILAAQGHCYSERGDAIVAMRLVANDHVPSLGS
jgi:hypothetical protein